MEVDLSPEEQATYARAMTTLVEAGVPFLVGGALAVHHYTGIWRATKDLDLVLLPEDRDRALQALVAAGYRVEITAAHWLAKAFADDMLIDLITGFGNWLHAIDDSWFAAAAPSTACDVPVRMISPTDLIWIKAYVAGRERFDGAEIAHIIHRAHDQIDWRRLLDRFAGHWTLLLAYLLMFRFVYAAAGDEVPDWLLAELTARIQADLRAPATPDLPFRGPLLDRYSYLVDIDVWGEPDPREEVARARGFPPDAVEGERAEDRRRLAEGKV